MGGSVRRRTARPSEPLESPSVSSHHQSTIGALRGLATAPPIILAALGAWAIVVPYLGPELGLRLDVASKLEFVDHVVPGTIAMLSGVLLSALWTRGGAASDWASLAAAGASFLAGVWIVSTHVPLIADATRGEADWGPTIWHNSAGFPIALLALWLLFQGLRDPGAARQ